MKIFRAKDDFDPGVPESVVAACKRNNPSAQRALLKLYYGYAKSIALRYSSDDETAGDILNESFLKVFNNIGGYDESKAFKTWLGTIVVHTAIDFYRKNSQIPEYEDVDELQISDFGEDAISSISAGEILSMVRSLSPVYRMVFSLYVIEGYSHKEIAEKLGIREGTSKSNLQDARKKLQNMILKLNPNLYAAYELKKLPDHEE